MGGINVQRLLTDSDIRAAATPAQTVIVQAGESLQAAINSITDATSEKTYLVLVYPGVSRSYTPKDNVKVVFLEDMGGGGGGGGGTPDDGSVTAAKLADALGAYILGAPTILAPSAIPGWGFTTVDIQLRDVKGANVAGKHVARVWLSDTAGGDVTTFIPDFTETIMVGVQLEIVVAKAHWVWISNENGVISFSIHTNTFPRTYYVNVEIGGRVYSAGPIRFQAGDGYLLL